MFNQVFQFNNYPVEWTKQHLRPERKRARLSKFLSYEEWQSRSSFLHCTTSSFITVSIYGRYTLNFEQVGFRPLMGYLLPIFAIYIVMEYLKSLCKTLHVGLL